MSAIDRPDSDPEPVSGKIDHHEALDTEITPKRELFAVSTISLREHWKKLKDHPYRTQ